MNVRLAVEITAPKMPNVSTIPALMNVVAKMVSAETDSGAQVLTAVELNLARLSFIYNIVEENFWLTGSITRNYQILRFNK